MLAILLAFSSFVDAAQKHVRQQAIDKDFANDVFAEICSREIAFPEIVMSQAILETGWFRNHYLMSRNNLFAFKKIKYLDNQQIQQGGHIQLETCGLILTLMAVCIDTQIHLLHLVPLIELINLFLLFLSFEYTSMFI
jgi:hypothetical protein